MNNQFFVGVDIGGTNVDAILVNNDQEELSFVTRPIKSDSQAKPVDIVIQVIEELVDSLSFGQRAQLMAIGVGVPGLVDTQTGRVELAVNLEEPSIELGSLLIERFERPVFIENDANAYAMAASKYLVDSSIKNLAFITLGTGVGSGLVLNGEIYHGSKNMAGEIGHIFVHENDVRCQCGLSGCLETFVAGPAVARQARAALDKGADSSLTNAELLDAAAVFEHAAKGDEIAQEIVEKVGIYLARATQVMMMAFDLQKIVIGGGLSRAGSGLLQPILAGWHEMRAQSIMASEMLEPEILELCPPDFRAGAWGAVAIAQHNFLNNETDPTEISFENRPHILKDTKSII